MIPHTAAEQIAAVLARDAADRAGQHNPVASRQIVESGEFPAKKFGLQVVFADGRKYSFGDFPSAGQGVLA